MSGVEDVPLDQYLTERRARVEQALERFLPSALACPPVIAEAMRYSVVAGGKRVRPILTLAAAEAVLSRPRLGPIAPGGGVAEMAASVALPAACAIEFIHTYSLIHDDLPAMDNDTLRRGRPTSHVVFGEGLAILAGDGLLTEAFALLAREPPSADPLVVARKLRTIGVIAAAAGAVGMVGGQAVDLQASGLGPGVSSTVLDAAGLQQMDARKTGALIRAAVVSGAIMAGGSDTEVDAAGRFADDLGLAFQIVDDILDVEGTTAGLGKTAGKDVAAGKPTYPALYGLDASRKLARECLDRAHQALGAGGLGHGRLAEIGEWIVARRH